MTDSNPYDGDYKWPTSLFDELYDQGKLAKLAYTMGYIFDASREAKKQGVEFYGINVDSDSDDRKQFTHAVADAELFRSFTPGEIKEVMEKNADFMNKFKPGSFSSEQLEGHYSFLEKLQAESDASGIERALALEEFDDAFQDKECVYGVTRDSVNKRITVVFRGTLTGYSEYTFKVSVSNWFSNLAIKKKKVEVPAILKKSEGSEVLAFHTGFYDYLFNETEKQGDAGTRKFDQIKDDVKSLLVKYPDHKVYVTGHSLGGALSTIAAFYLACEEDMPKPISCVNFAAPRVAGSDFHEAVHQLEKDKLLRIIRSVNENDTVTTIPPGRYSHVGFQCTAYASHFWNRTPNPDINHLNPNAGFFGKLGQKWTNGLLSNLNVAYDHSMSEYLKRIVNAKSVLEKKSLNQLYVEEKVFESSLKSVTESPKMCGM